MEILTICCTKQGSKNTLIFTELGIHISEFLKVVEEILLLPLEKMGMQLLVVKNKSFINLEERTNIINSILRNILAVLIGIVVGGFIN